MAYQNKQFGEHQNQQIESVYSKRVKAGKRRTYFFDVRPTKGNDYYITITETIKRQNGDGYDRHKTFVYKEDFNKFIEGLTDVVNHVKTELMPNFDFDSFNNDFENEEEGSYNNRPRFAPEVNNDGAPQASALQEEENFNIQPQATPQPASNNFEDNLDDWKL